MKFKVFYSADYDDDFVITANSIEEAIDIITVETKIRGWDPEYCWSVCIEDDVPHKETTLLAES